MDNTYISLKIIPLSPFATKPSSDSFFGQICYMLFLNGYNLDDILCDYENNPFLVVSDFFPMGHITAPPMPLKPSGEINVFNLAKRKTLKKKNQLNIEELLKNQQLIINENGLINETVEDTNSIIHTNYITRASINRELGSTTKGKTASYSSIEYEYSAKNSEFYFQVYIYVKPEHEDKVIQAIKDIGKAGYGKKASIGRGYYEVKVENSVTINTEGCNGILFLSNTVISSFNKYCEKIYYTPVTRYGKHGLLTSSHHPFKKPFVMALNGALAFNIADDIFIKPYIGMAVTDISHNKNTKTQGYGLYLPLKIKE